jgi:hypothetical protein
MKHNLLLAAALMCATAPAMAQEGAAGAVQNRSIAYVLNTEYYAIHQSEGGKDECPNGFNDGPREQYKILFPDDGTKRKLVDTQLAREAEVWFPHTTKEIFEFKEAGGKVAPGINLDGKVGPNDFTDPDGEKGVDNQLFRAIGCVNNYRDNYELNIITTKWRTQHNFNRFLFVLTDVDSLVNDDDVTLTTYRGLDKLVTDSTGQNFLPGGSQRIDLRWGKEFISKFHARIKDGVLTTDAQPLRVPEMAAFEDVSVFPFKSAQFKLKLTTDKADGVLMGYVEIDGWYAMLNEGWATHHLSYGQQSAPSLYRALRRLADGFPDPKTGEMTAISGGLDLKFSQVFVNFPREQTAAKDTDRKPARH